MNRHRLKFYVLWINLLVQLNLSTPCALNRYGARCERQCYCAEKEECDPETGECPKECEANWRGPCCNQTSCPLNTYGPFCNNLCFCAKEQQCHVITGSCHVGCIDGVKGDTCNQSSNDCDVNRWGPDCRYRCNCGGNRLCSSTTGRCLQKSISCTAPWSGKSCRDTKCPNTRFGLNCTYFCICIKLFQCSLLDGVCPNSECEIGWKGPSCNTTLCPVGWYGGEKCDMSCACHSGVPCNYHSGKCLDVYVSTAREKKAGFRHVRQGGFSCADGKPGLRLIWLALIQFVPMMIYTYFRLFPF